MKHEVGSNLPSGQFFPLGEFDYEEGIGTTHSEWAMADIDWLVKEYHLNKYDLEMSSDPVQYLVEKRLDSHY